MLSHGVLPQLGRIRKETKRFIVDLTLLEVDDVQEHILFDECSACIETRGQRQSRSWEVRRSFQSRHDYPFLAFTDPDGHEDGLP